MKTLFILIICFPITNTVLAQQTTEYWPISRLPDSLSNVITKKLRTIPWDTATRTIFDSSWTIILNSKEKKSYRVNFQLFGDSISGRIDVALVDSSFSIDTAKYFFKEYSLPCVCKNHGKHECDCNDKVCKAKLEKEQKCIGWVYDSR